MKIEDIEVGKKYWCKGYWSAEKVLVIAKGGNKIVTWEGYFMRYDQRHPYEFIAPYVPPKRSFWKPWTWWR